MKAIFTGTFLLISTLFAIAQKPTLEIYGNRGARGLMPENTIPGMIKALEEGATALKIEVVITKDQKVIASAEPFFNNEISLNQDGEPITLKDEKKYNIYAMNYDEVKNFDVGSKPHPRFPYQEKFRVGKPLLSDLIDKVETFVKKSKRIKPTYCIEVKIIRNGDLVFNPEPKAFVDLVMNVIKQKKIEDRTTIYSFDLRPLQYVHQKYPAVKTALGVDEKNNFEILVEKLGFKPTIYSPYLPLVGKGLIDKCHATGVQVVPWNVNTPKDLQYFKSLGVDGIITDYPDLASKSK